MEARQSDWLQSVLNHRARARAGVPRGARRRLSHGDLMCGLPDFRWKRVRSQAPSVNSIQRGPAGTDRNSLTEPDSVLPRPRSSTAAKRRSVYGYVVSEWGREWDGERARAEYRAARCGDSAMVT